MGVAAHLNVTPFGAIICGFLISIVSVLGYRYLTPFLSKKMNIQDICGVNNLHGMPGIGSCIVGIFVSLGATREKYGSEYDALFPKGPEQAGYQAAGLFITLGVAIVGGCFTGLLMARGWRIAGIVSSDFYNDRTFWTNPSDYESIIDKVQEEEKDYEAKDDEYEMKDVEQGEIKNSKHKKTDSSVKFLDEKEQANEKKELKELKEQKKNKKKAKEVKEDKKEDKKDKRSKEDVQEKKPKEKGTKEKIEKKKDSSSDSSSSSSSSSDSSDSKSADK